MDTKTLFEHIDPELIERIGSRREALQKVGKLGLAVASVPVAFGLMARDAFAQALPQEVVDILNFALTLEYLEAEYYNTALATAGLIPAETEDVFQQIAQHENAHVALLEGLLGDAATSKPTFDYTAGGTFNPFEDYAIFLALSQGFEDTGVRAYKGQAPQLIDFDDVLTTALRIHSVEARHAAEVRRLRGPGADQPQAWITLDNTNVQALEPVYQGEAETTQLMINTAQLSAPNVSGAITTETASEAFDEPLTMEQVLNIANMFIAD